MTGWKWFYNYLQLRLIGFKCKFEMQYVRFCKRKDALDYKCEFGKTFCPFQIVVNKS